jgi:sphingomyelin phosphodiesterase acid-like 3
MKKALIISSSFIVFVFSLATIAQTGWGATLGKPTGRVLLISDIHFDPLADLSILEDLTNNPADQWEGIFAKSKQNQYARAPADTNYPLLKSALCAAKAQGPYDFVIASGDYLRHNFQERFPAVSKRTSDPAAFATKTVVFVINALQKTFGVPVYVALGNNDSSTGDYDVDPLSAFLVTLGHSIGVLAKDPEAEADFCTGGYYELAHPDLANEEIIVLNTVLWSRPYGIIGSKVVEPGLSEMDWFAEKLNQAETLRHKVILVMHIPPGLDSYSCSRQKNGRAPIEFWENAFLTKFCDLIREHGGIIQIALAGHTHTDDFRVVGTKDNSSPVFLRITPSISPIYLNNPGFSVLKYDPTSGDILDILTYYLNLSPGGTDPQWKGEYSFSRAYESSSLSPANMLQLAARIHDDPKVRQIFAGFYAVSAPSPITDTNWPFFSCAQTILQSANYSRCVQGQ